MNSIYAGEIVPSAVDEFSPSRRRLVSLMVFSATLAGLGTSGCGRSESERPWRGSPFPAFALPTTDGTVHDSNEYFGRPLLINLWATWCPPCRREMGDLNALHRHLGPKGLQLLAISVDADLNLVKEYLRRENIGFSVLVDGDQRWSASVLRVPGFPTTYLVGKDGIIIDAWLGPRAWDDPVTQAAIVANVGMN